MSHGESVERATQWLQELINELPGLRNATSRDPGFKNWRQNAITNIQRIWPADQNHAERFRRIPFSPVDPRADVRLQRESFSRGCQEAGRVLNSFIEEIRASGVPDLPDGALPTEESGLEDGFPTVDLPSGDLHGSQAALSAAELEQLPPQGADPSFLPPSRLHIDTPPEGTSLPKHHSTPPSDARQKRKGLGVAAKLRDLLGLTGFGEKATPPPPQSTGTSSAMTQLPARSLDIIPVGDEVDTRPRSKAWPVPQQPKTHTPGAPPAQPAASSPPAPQPPSPAPAKGNAPPAEAGMSVVMSRPTTLRANIEKVSIESLISPEFRGGTEDNAASKAAATPHAGATPSAPAENAAPPPAAATSPAAGRPPLSIVPPLSGDPEFNVPTPPASEPAAESPAAAQKKIVPLPLPPVASDAEPEPESDPEADAEADAPIHSSDSAELSRATADFMRTSPVLGATGRKVQRGPHESSEHGFSDPDAIAIASMFDELTAMGVPTSRQSEARARLLDLARRIEAEDLPWSALKKSVWFAMEYPEVARRLIPMLLPWIDRAA